MSVAEPDVQPMSTFDRLFVEGASPSIRTPRPLPGGWSRAPMVESLRAMPQARRETVMAMGFGLLALVYGPLGIVALITGHVRSYLFVTIVVALLVAAPRPPLAQRILATIATRVGELRLRAVTAIRARRSAG